MSTLHHLISNLCCYSHTVKEIKEIDNFLVLVSNFGLTLANLNEVSIAYNKLSKSDLAICGMVITLHGNESFTMTFLDILKKLKNFK